MITAIYIPLTPLKELLHVVEADDLLCDIKGTPHLTILCDETIQHINCETQVIRIGKMLNPSES